ncbi:hypothetical protein RhiirA4_483217 [Rhizophagus irregularis]|uniref:Uncharacterized protein n=1 Tax=Rhizophagus irregularis TaxID=588596 RepID=A0A2I1HM99_9GLOM|nr:hypothetical protein RhiirA4_483217 [Rhizophagus irregularis]
MKEIGEEVSNYPMNRTIIWKSRTRSFQYYIIEEGFYPPKPYLAYTRMPNHYPIPDNYVVETTYGKNKKTVTCFINYYNEKPYYKIKFGQDESECVYSGLSPTAVANSYLKAYNKKVADKERIKNLNFQGPIPTSKIDGIHLFGLQLLQIKSVRDSMKMTRNVKPFSEITDRMQIIRNKNFSIDILTRFKNQVEQHFNLKDKVVVNELVFKVNDSRFRIVYQPKEDDEMSRQLAIIQIMDNNLISRSTYRALAAIIQELPREGAISKELHKINHIMNENIPIHSIELQSLSESGLDDGLEIHITDPEIIREVESLLGKGATRSIKDVLKFLIPSMIEKGILNYSESTLHIRISGDGRNVGHRVKHVMVTFTILNKMNIFNSDSHFALLIYPGAESYNTLKIALISLIADLDDIKTGFTDGDGHQWNIELYFSADWKFLSICLGHKAANCTNFCLWCSIDKSQNGILETNGERQDYWSISKNIEEINQNYKSIPGHKYPPLFPMIPIHNWVVDELHLMLRIFDRLWTLVLSELRSTRSFNDQVRQTITSEMCRIHVKFNFWENQETKTWQFTSLAGNDKLKVLQNFNLNVVFNPQRAAIIRELWDGFIDLYNDMRSLTISGDQFHQKARQWLKLFLTRSQGNINSPEFVRGLYRPTDLTPYIHVLVYHVPEFIDIHRNIGLLAFSCSGVEKKNHDHVLHFFQRTMKDGGSENQKSAIVEIMECENRFNFFYTHNTLTDFKKDTTINNYSDAE